MNGIIRQKNTPSFFEYFQINYALAFFFLFTSYLGFDFELKMPFARIPFFLLVHMIWYKMTIERGWRHGGNSGNNRSSLGG